jgi:hypothetical protein
MLYRNRTASLLLIALVAAGCGGSKHGSTTGIPGGGTAPGDGTSPGNGSTPGDGTPGSNTSGSQTTALSIGADVTIAKGRTHQFHAQLSTDGVPGDDCTGIGQWASSDPAVATVAGGLVTTLGLGQTTINASCPGASDAALLVVTDPEIDSIAISPATGDLPVGLTQQLTAVATLSDQTTANVSDVVWSSSNPFAFSVSNVGMITAGNAVGQTSDITAFHNASQKLASTTRKVTAAALTSIAVTASAAWPVADPAAPSVPLGVDVQFQAIGKLSDGTSVPDLGSLSVSWASSNTNVASISTAGLASTNTIGTATITATPSGVAPASATLTVTDAVVDPDTVAIDPSPDLTLTAGETFQLNAVATLTDGITPATVTLTNWQSSRSDHATVSGTGFVTAVAPDFATISADYAAPDGRTITVTTQVTVVSPTSSPVLSYLSLTPGSVKSGKRPVKGTVALTAPATAATVVTLAANPSTNVTVPGSVTISAGSSSAQFSITTTHTSMKQKVKITATLGTATKTATLNLRN